MIGDEHLQVEDNEDAVGNEDTGGVAESTDESAADLSGEEAEESVEAEAGEEEVGEPAA